MTPAENPIDPNFDPSLPGHPDPYPLFHQLRSEDPIRFSPHMGGWVILRYVDAIAFLRDHGPFSRAALIDQMRAKYGSQPIIEGQSRELAFSDPPGHTRFKNLVSRAFTPQAVAAMRPHLIELVDGLLDKLADRDRMDVIAEFAYPLPSIAICGMLGVPQSDAAQMIHWVDGIVASRGVVRTPEMIAEGDRATLGFDDYFTRQMEQREQHPGGKDLLTAFMTVEYRGDRLSRREILTILSTIFAAGHATTINLIGNGLLALLRNPGELKRLRENPDLVAGAVEEMLRYDSPTQAVSPMVAQADLSIGGKPVKKGETVSVLIGACNRDPERFADPDRFDIKRPDNEHLAFSHGIHYCLGAGLARLEGQVAIARLLERKPKIALADDRLEWKKMGRFRGLKRLQVTL
ncbi:MAG: cytochrome P450 [Candidatus Binataceae bacterium]|nr:cytochrome P450 [Candidatus Binataceae bacterium]